MEQIDVIEQDSNNKNTPAATSLSTERNESYTNHSQVPNKTASTDCIQDINNKTERSTSRDSEPSIISFLRIF